MRSKHKWWRNGRGGRWTCRIIWYGEGQDCHENVRLKCECEYGVMNLFPNTLSLAGIFWATFRKLVEAGDMDALWQWMQSGYKEVVDTGIREISDTYFKDYGDGQTFISGLPIPKDADGVCRKIRFIRCDFHAGCAVPYEDCEFVECHGLPKAD